MLADIKSEESDARSGRFTLIVSVLGALLLGTGLILFFASNWESLGHFTKLILITLLPIIPLVGGYYLSEIKKDFPILGKSLIFLGVLLIGASLALYGQLYHLESNPRWLFLTWFLLSIPFTYIIPFGALALAHTILYIVWFHLEFAFRDGMWGIEPKEKTFVLWSLGMGLDLLIIGLLLQWKTKIFTAVHTAYRQFGLFFVLLTGWIYTLWIYVTEVLDYSDMARLGLNLLYIAVLAAGVWIGVTFRKSYVISQTFFWIAVYLISLYFDFFWSLVDRSLFFMVLGLIGLVGGFWLEKWRKKVIALTHTR
jgi:uncharacterized membrane protein